MQARVNKADEARLFRNLNTLVKKVCMYAREGAKQAGNEYLNIVKEGINVTAAPSWAGYWPPLSGIWKAEKTAHKKEFWIETGGIRRGLRTDVILNTMLIVQIFAGLKQSTDPQAFERALKNEYGAEGMGLWGERGVKRPLFGPATDTFSYRVGAGQRKMIPGGIQSIFKNVAKRAVREVYG